MRSALANRLPQVTSGSPVHLRIYKRAVESMRMTGTLAFTFILNLERYDYKVNGVSRSLFYLVRRVPRLRTTSHRWQAARPYIYGYTKGQSIDCPFVYGANDGNRTHDRSLGSCCFTIKLHSHEQYIYYHIDMSLASKISKHRLFYFVILFI